MTTYLDQDQALKVLNEMGVAVNARQLKRAAEPDADGRRKLPFFRDPIDGRLKIERDTLKKIYLDRQVEAERSCYLIDDFSL